MKFLVVALLMVAGMAKADAPQSRSELIELCRQESRLAYMIVQARQLGRSLADATVSVNGDRYLEELIDIAYSLPVARGEDAQGEQRQMFADMVFSACRKKVSQETSGN